MSAIVISDETSVIFHWFIYTAMCQTICTFGLGTNIINIVCFIKQGFTDPVNVSLLGLTLSDIGCLLTMSVVNVCFTPAFRTADLPFDSVGFSYLTGGMPHTTLTRVTGWFTALITLERCLCITAPLKVKTLVTSKRMTYLLIFVFSILIISAAPVFVVNRLVMQFDPEKNKSLLVIFYTEDRENVEKFSFGINNVFLPFTAFVIIIVCTIILVVMLKKKSQWRTQSSTTTQADNVSTRNKNVAKMVVMISSLFIACFLPISFTFFGMCLVPEFSLSGKYKDLLYIIGGFGFILESINSSVNIFIYYRMSSKYRHTFQELFSCNKTKCID